MTYDAVTAALAELRAAHPGVVESTREVPRETSVWSDCPPLDKNELHQHLQENLEETARTLAACEAATSNWDDERRWDQLAGALSAVVREWPGVGLDVLDAVGSGHTQIDLAVIRGWSAARPDAELTVRILDRIGLLELEPILASITALLGGFAAMGSNPVEWFQYIQSEALARRCWETIAPATASAVVFSDDYSMMALNHPAGQLAEYWVQRLAHLWRAADENWRGIPPSVAEYLAGLTAEDSRRSEAVQIAFCRYLSFFHQADAVWCKQYLFPLFDWSDESRARRAWSGFLAQGTWSDRLLSDGFLEMLVASFSHRGQLDKTGRRNFPGLLAKLAVAADIDPLTWLRDFVTVSAPSDRVEWARAIRHQLSSLESVEVERQWERWIRRYLTDRVNGVPRPLAPEEVSAMASWPLFLQESMADAVELIVQTDSAGLELHNLFLHDLGPQQIERAPGELARLLHHLLMSTAVGTFHGQHGIEEAHAQFKSAGVDRDILRQIEEDALTLGFTLE
jgi:hypothetical protein